MTLLYSFYRRIHICVKSFCQLPNVVFFLPFYSTFSGLPGFLVSAQKRSAFFHYQRTFPKQEDRPCGGPLVLIPGEDSNGSGSEWSAGGIAALRRRWRKKQSYNFRSGRKTQGKCKPAAFFALPQGGGQSRDPACPAGQVESFSRFYQRKLFCLHGKIRFFVDSPGIVC